MIMQAKQSAISQSSKGFKWNLQMIDEANQTKFD